MTNETPTPTTAPIPLHGGADMRCQALTDALLATAHERANGLPIPMILGCLRLVEHTLIQEACE